MDSIVQDEFIQAVKVGKIETIVEYFQNYPIDLEYLSNEGCTALVTASIEGHLDVVKYLVANGANIFAANSTGWNSFMLASAYGHYEIVEFFLQIGMNVNLHNDNGCTAIMMACVRGHVPIVNRLITAGAEVEAVNGTKHNALLVASWYGHVYIVYILLNYDVEINCATADGKTPLSLAAEYGHLSTVLLLLDRGANPFIKDNEGHIAYDYAADKSIRDILLIYQSTHRYPEINKAEGSSLDQLHLHELNNFHKEQLDLLKTELKYWESVPATEFSNGKSYELI